MFLGSHALNDFHVPVQSMEQRKFASVLRQKYDFSCGSAALATLLHYHYGRPQTEQSVFLGMWQDGDQEKIRKLGFSLLDMKRYLLSSGFKADGYKVTLSQIADAKVPGIVLLTINSYAHFVVVKGIHDDKILVGDPALGLRTMRSKDFLKAWNQIYFVIDNASSAAHPRFNLADQWAAVPSAPIKGRFLEPVSQQALSLTAPFYRDF